jgi:hypothetical protein
LVVITGSQAGGLRQGRREDAPALGRIYLEAFKAISSLHNFPWDFPSVEVAKAAVSDARETAIAKKVPGHGDQTIGGDPGRLSL